MHHPQIIEASQYSQENYSQKGNCRREAENSSNKMQKFKFAFMFIFFVEILLQFHSVSQALQNEKVILKSCVDLCSSLADYVHASRNELRRFEEAANEIISCVDYEATLTLKRKIKKVINDGDAPEVSLNARDKFHMLTFYVIIHNHKAEMSRRWKVHYIYIHII